MKPLQSVIVLLLAVALGVIGAQWLGANDLRQYGEVILRHGGTDYRSTLPQVVLLALVVLLVLWLLWSLVASPFRAWGRYRRKQGRVRLVDGLQAYEQGQWQRAEKLFDGAAQDQEVTAVALANAARSAQARGDNAASQGYLQRLAGTDATTQALLRAEQLLADDLPVDAINALDAANLQPLPPRGLWLRGEALARAGRAHEAYGQLGALRQSKVLPADAARDPARRRTAQARHAGGAGHAGSPPGCPGAAGSCRRECIGRAMGNNTEGAAGRSSRGIGLCRTRGGTGLGRTGTAGAGAGAGPALE